MTEQKMSVQLKQQLEGQLFDEHGPMMFGAALHQALGYRSGDAFRQAASRGKVPVYVFPIKNRRGKFALTKDVAQWLASQRYQNETDRD